METGKLTPKSNDTINAMRFAGRFDQPDGFGSVLEVKVAKSGSAALTLNYLLNGEEHMWSIMLDNEQRNALSEMLVEYQPTLFEEL